jgi:uncharacterized repeat protein (TIGR02543 family)/LPXTG-motif cell wall-anchored protein
VADGATSVWGGAVTTSDTPTVGGSPSRYISAPSTPSSLTLTFFAPQKYVGFWWSAGSSGNTVKFYTAADAINPIATFTTNTINSILGSSAPNPYPGSSVVTALNGSSYKKGYYFGRPAAHTSLTPTANTSGNTESHAFLNLYASGSIAFTKVEFTGGGFEFDNIAISSNPASPPGGLVFIESVYGKSVTFLANGGSGTMTAQTSNGTETLTANSFTRDGYTFAGWHTNSSGTGGTSYTDGQSYNFSADITLHAQWTPLTYNVTYDEQGGTTVSDGTYTTGSTITLPAAPTQAGFTFAGWFIASTGGTALGATYAPPGTGNIIIYAQWTSNTPPVPPPSSNSESPTTTQPIVAPVDTAPSLVAPPRVRRGSTVTVVAVGFIPGESVQIRIGDSGAQQSLVADANGEVRITVKIAPGENQSSLTAQASAGTRKTSKVIQVADVESVLPSTGNTPTSSLSALALLVLGMAMLVGARRLSAPSNHRKSR